MSFSGKTSQDSLLAQRPDRCSIHSAVKFLINFKTTYMMKAIKGSNDLVCHVLLGSSNQPVCEREISYDEEQQAGLRLRPGEEEAAANLLWLRCSSSCVAL